MSRLCAINTRLVPRDLREEARRGVLFGARFPLDVLVGAVLGHELGLFAGAAAGERTAAARAA
jgi:hypothetical protein